MLDAILLALFILLPKVGMFDFSLMVLALHLIVAFISERKINSNVNSINGSVAALFVMIVLIYWLSFTSFIVNGGDHYDAQFLFKPFRILLVLCTLYYIFNKRYISLPMSLNAIVIAALLNALVIYFQYFDSFSGGSGDFLQNPNFNESVITPYRKSGLMSGFPVAGILSFCGAMVSLHFFINNRSKCHFILYMIIGITCFITARTALFLFLSSTLTYLTVMCLKNGKIYVLFLFVIVFFGAFTFIFNSDNNVIIKSREKMFANVINYSNNGNINDYSTDDLLTNHYTLPNDFPTLIIGNSISPEENIVNTDVSFFRITWHNGLFSMLLYVGCFLFMWYFSITSSIPNKRTKLIIFMIFMGVFISNFKGFYFFSRVIGDLIFIIFISCIVNESKSDEVITNG